MKKYLVISPQYSEIIPITDEGQGPLEYVRDIIEIEAENSEDAKALGVKLMFADYGCKYVRNRRSDRLCPYTGIKAIEQN